MSVVSDSPVFPAILMPTQQFVKRWTIENAGTCPWPALTQMVLTSGDELEIVSKSDIGALAPGETVQVRISLIAPAAYDAYTSVWQLQYGDGESIGGPLQITYRVGATPTPRPTPTSEFTPTPTELLWMSIPGLTWCGKTPFAGRVEWGRGGGISDDYRYFYGSVSPETELEGTYREFEGFPHTETYYTTSGNIVFPVPEECGTGTYGRCGSAAEGFEIVWYKVHITPGDCPPVDD
jgi:hypothetical protein